MKKLSDAFMYCLGLFRKPSNNNHNIATRFAVLEKGLADGGLSTSAMMIFPSYHLSPIQNSIADMKFAINQISDIGYLSRNVARGMIGNTCGEGITIYAYCHGNTEHIVQYMSLVVELSTIYDNMRTVGTIEATHTCNLLEGYLEVQRKVLVNMTKCL